MKKLVFTLFVLSSTNVLAHSGRTNAYGCHTEKATGIYHCHNSTPTPAPIYTPPVVQQPTSPVYTPPVVETPVYVPPVDPKPIAIPVATIEPSNAYNFNIVAETNDILQLQYEGFTLWLDCNRKGVTKFRYNAQRDTGSFPRVENFAIDSNVPADCQQTSAKSYGKNYDRGHLVPANHLDYSANAIAESNYMTNILPQAANMNRGAWLATEEIVECYRDTDELLVIGGVIYGNNKKDDYFVKSHGVETPDSFWKVIIRGNGDAIAWNVPNTSAATRAKLNNYLVTVAQIEKLTGESIPVSENVKKQKLTKSWVLPKNCDKG